MKPRAELSQCGKYRYVLRRQLVENAAKKKPITFVMLNPSTADANTDDPTIRRCIAFAKREGGTELIVINLFGLRATDPKELNTEFREGIGNQFYCASEIAYNRVNEGLVIAAWGSNKFAREMSKSFGLVYGPLLCLGITKTGQPKHPLYLKSDSPLIEFKPET